MNYNSEGESGLLIRVVVPRVRKRRTNYLSPVKLLSPGSGRKFVSGKLRLYLNTLRQYVT